MALSDDVASLKVEVHKLAVAIEELAIKRYIKGEIDKSKLPWFTPQYVPGDSIKVSGNRVPTAAAYFDNNEVIASSTSSFLYASNTLLGAHQVFEKMPEPILSSNNDQVAVIGDSRLLNDIDEVQPSVNSVPEPYVDGIVPDVRTTHKPFHTMPVPDFILEMAKAAKVTHEENQEIADAHQVFDEIPEPISHLTQVQMLRTNDDKTRIHLIAGSSAVPCIKLAENETLPTLNFNTPNGLSGGHNMVDRLPVPTFILEMAQAAKITQENEDMAYAHQVFDKIPEPTKQANMSQTLCQAVVNVDHYNLLCGMILEPTFRYQFVFDPGVLFLLSSTAGKDPCLSFFNFKIGWKAKINYKEVHSWGKLYPTLGWCAGHWSTIWRPHFQYDPVMFSQRVDYIVEVVRLYASDLHKLVMSVGISLMFNACELLLVFDPGDHSWSDFALSFSVRVLSSWIAEQEFLLSYKPHFSFTAVVMLALVLTLEDKDDFKREGEYAMSTYTNCANPGIIAKITYEQFRTSNVSRVGCRKDIILLILVLLKYGDASFRISDVGTPGFDNFEYVSRSFKISKVLPFGTLEQWSITMRTMLEN